MRSWLLSRFDESIELLRGVALRKVGLELLLGSLGGFLVAELLVRFREVEEGVRCAIARGRGLHHDLELAGGLRVLVLREVALASEEGRVDGLRVVRVADEESRERAQRFGIVLLVEEVLR